MARKNSRNSSFIADWFDGTASWLRGAGGTISFVAICACILLTIGFMAFGMPRLRQYLDQKSFVEARNITVTFVNPPAWLDRTLAADMQRMVANAVGDGSALDPARLTVAHDALVESGWFKSIDQVRLEGNGGFIVEARFRMPFALVVHGGREHLIDDEGCRLPAEWNLGERPASPHWITIVHAESTPPGQPGAPWSGRDLAAAIEFIKLTWNRPWQKQIAAVDLERFAGDGLVVMTGSGGYVLWGAAPSVASSAEPPAQAKLKNLDHLFATTGFIDNGGGRIIDLRTDMPSVKLAAEAAQ